MIDEFVPCMTFSYRFKNTFMHLSPSENNFSLPIAKPYFGNLMRLAETLRQFPIRI